MSNPLIKAIVKGSYDIQMLRLAAGQRLVQQFKKKLGIDATKKEDDEEQDKEAQKLMNELRAAYKKITDGVKRELPSCKAFKAEGLISDYAELCLLHSYMMLEKQEEGQFARLGTLLKGEPIWEQFFDGVKGCGPAMAGALMAVIDISKARHPSSVHQYCGYGVGPDGRGMGRHSEHLVEREYVDMDDVVRTKKGLVYNPWIRTKLFVLAGCMLKCGSEPYAQIYRDRKHRTETDPNWAEDVKRAQWEAFMAKTPKKLGKDGKPLKRGTGKYAHKLHVHNHCVRIMIKQFLTDMYVVWRTIEGLPVSLPYSEAKLHMEPHGGRAA